MFENKSILRNNQPLLPQKLRNVGFEENHQEIETKSLNSRGFIEVDFASSIPDKSIFCFFNQMKPETNLMSFKM